MDVIGLFNDVVRESLSSPPLSLAVMQLLHVLPPMVRTLEYQYRTLEASHPSGISLEPADHANIVKIDRYYNCLYYFCHSFLTSVFFSTAWFRHVPRRPGRRRGCRVKGIFFGGPRMRPHVGEKNYGNGRDGQVQTPRSNAS